MKKQKHLLSKDTNGEIVYDGLNDHIKKSYRPDTPMDKSFVPYLVMLFCCAVDCTVFLSLFSLISYDSPVMLAVQVSGFLFAFDVVPIYLGIQHRRVRQGLSRDRFIMYLALGVFLAACVINVVLRLTTMELVAPDLSGSISAFGSPASQPVSGDTAPNYEAIAQTVVGIGLPILTSCGSYFISFLTYNPLLVRKQRQEELLGQKQDEIRRIEAVLEEYTLNDTLAQEFREEDEERFDAAQEELRAKVAGYCDYVRLRIMEQLADPTSISALSQGDCEAILARLDRELETLNRQTAPQLALATVHNDNTAASGEAAA